MPKIGYSRRALALGRDGLVASCHPLATLAGVETLKAGGTAADAAVATNAVLAVTQSNNCGVGGDLFCLYWEAATRRVHFLSPAGRAPAPGEMFVQPDLARTLRDLAAEGPDLFYRGRIARAIAERMAREGFLTPEDLAAHRGEWGEPVSTTYRGFTVYETPPPTQGVTALLALNMLEGVELAKHPLHSVEHLHLLLEVVKLAYADRDRWIADPQHARLPLSGMLDKAYAARRLAQFDPERATAYAPGEPEGDTTGFVVADGEGNVAAVIQSLFNSFGSGVVPPGTGFCL